MTGDAALIAAENDAFVQLYGQHLPAFYVAFVAAETLLHTRLFSPLTRLFGVDELIAKQANIREYLPNYLLIGDNGGDYGIFIRLGVPGDERIYICELGCLFDEDISCLASDFATWAANDFDTESFLSERYESRVSQPRADLQHQIRALSTRLAELTVAKAANTISLKSFLLEKRAITAALTPLQAELQRLTEADLGWTISCRQIERRFAVQLPSLYKALASDGMLAYADAFGPKWRVERLPMLKSEPPFLLYARDFELLALRDVFELGGDGALLPTPRDAGLRLLPFAQNDAGDQYSFAFSDQAPREPSIVLWLHDEDRFMSYARDLQDFIFLKMLEVATCIRLDSDLVGEGNVQANLLAWLETHRRYLQPQQVAVLREIYMRQPVSSGEGTSVQLLLEGEYADILKADGMTPAFE